MPVTTSTSTTIDSTQIQTLLAQAAQVPPIDVAVTVVDGEPVATITGCLKAATRIHRALDRGAK